MAICLSCKLCCPLRHRVCEGEGEMMTKRRSAITIFYYTSLVDQDNACIYCSEGLFIGMSENKSQQQSI